MCYLLQRGVIKRTPPGEIFQNESGLGQTCPSVIIVIFYPIPQRVPFVYILMKSTFCPSSLPPTVELLTPRSGLVASTNMVSRGSVFSCTSKHESTQLSQASTNVVLC